jgi:hypothetical protein
MSHSHWKDMLKHRICSAFRNNENPLHTHHGYYQPLEKPLNNRKKYSILALGFRNYNIFDGECSFYSWITSEFVKSIL